MATLLKPAAAQRIDIAKQPERALSSRPIESSRYWSRDFMDREWDGIWTRTWLIGGLEARVRFFHDTIDRRLGG